MSRAQHLALPGSMLAFLAVASIAFAPDVSASTAARRIPSTVRNNRIVLPVTFADSRPLRVVLDSGMAYDGLLITNSALVDSIALPGANRANIGGARSGPPQTALYTDSLAFRAGDAVLTGQRVIILEGDAMRGFPTDGVCGHTLLGSHNVEIGSSRCSLSLSITPLLVSGNADRLRWTGTPTELAARLPPREDLGPRRARRDTHRAGCERTRFGSEAPETRGPGLRGPGPRKSDHVEVGVVTPREPGASSG